MISMTERISQLIQPKGGYMNFKEFEVFQLNAKHLNERIGSVIKEKKVDAKKIHVYRKQGKLPIETIWIGNKPYWLKEEALTYISTNQKINY